MHVGLSLKLFKLFLTLSPTNYYYYSQPQPSFENPGWFYLKISHPEPTLLIFTPLSELTREIFKDPNKELCKRIAYKVPAIYKSQQGKNPPGFSPLPQNNTNPN